jgi:hypothetical protein
VVGVFGVADLALGTIARVTMRRPAGSMKSKLSVALAAALGLVCVPVGAAADATISGVYSFAASDFGNSLTDSSIPSPLTEISGSFGFSYTYAPDNPPISGNDPLIIPSSIDLTFGSTTFVVSDLRLSIMLEVFSICVWRPAISITKELVTIFFLTLL